MRIVAISDTHGFHAKVRTPQCDLLIHSGDFCARGTVEEAEDFIDWLVCQPTEDIVVVPGNHDWCTFHQEEIIKELFERADIKYLRDSSTKVGDLNIYGSPWTPKFFDWAWMLERGPDIDYMWKKIPKNTDILVTHGPPAGKADFSLYGKENAGCYNLREAIERIKPKFHFFGHIHYSYGIAQGEHTLYVNAAICNEKYEPVNAPIQVDT